jgi:hypothetical protein
MRTEKKERKEKSEGETHCNIWSKENSGDMSILSSVPWMSKNSMISRRLWNGMIKEKMKLRITNGKAEDA